jgi:hypothetical protein
MEQSQIAGARRGARLRRQQANGARYEDTRVDRRPAFCGVARGSATNTTAARRKRPKEQFDTHQHRRYLPGGNGRDVLQTGIIQAEAG